MTVTVSGAIADVLGHKDSRAWKVWSPVYHGGSGGSVVTTREQTIHVSNGVFSAELEPGYAVIESPDGDKWTVAIPATDTSLWAVIRDALAVPPDTSAELLAAAVDAYFVRHPSSEDLLSGPIDLRRWDAIREGQWKFSLAAYTSGGFTLTNNTAPFTQADVGKIVVDAHTHGEARWMANIVSVNGSGVATLDAATPRTHTNSAIHYGFDVTEALNAALLAVAGYPALGDDWPDMSLVDGMTPREVYLPGWYRASQVVVPLQLTLRGAGWGSYGNGFEGKAGTLLHQLPGSECDFLIFSGASSPGLGDSAEHWFGPVGVTNLCLQGPEHNVIGHGRTVGSGFALRDPDGNPLVAQDGCEFSWIHSSGFPENGFDIPAGGVPLTLRSCRAFYNGKYGWDYQPLHYARTQMVHLLDCSCDANVLGGARFRDCGPYGSVAITAFKSEAVSDHLFSQRFDAEDGFSGADHCQMSALIFENCEDSPIVVNGVSHIYSGALQATGPTILIKSDEGYDPPRLVYNAIATRLAGTEIGDTSDSVTLRDELNGVDVPRSKVSGIYMRGFIGGEFFPNEWATLASAETLYLKTLKNPKIDGSLYDQNGNRIIGHNVVANAVNYVQVSNRAAGVGNPTLAARGSDEVIALDLLSQNGGGVWSDSNRIATRSTVVVTGTTTLGAYVNHEYTYILRSGAVPTLPTAVNNKTIYHIKNTHTASINLYTTSSQTIDGTAAPIAILPKESYTLVSDNSNWVVTGKTTGVVTAPLFDIACWGDSLTYSSLASGHASPSWPETLAARLGVAVYNGGKPSHGSAEIATRQGGLQPLVTVTSNQIPSGATSRTVTAISPTDGWRTATDPGNHLDMHGTLAGVAGNLRQDLTDVSQFSFVPDSPPGTTVSVPAGTAFIGDEGVSLRDRINIIWAGRNNSSQPTAIARDIASMVAWLTPIRRFLILSHTGAKATADAVNNPLRLAYGSNYVDLRGFLIKDGLNALGITPTGTDLTDIAAGNVPTSLLDDGTHFTQEAYDLIGEYLATIVKSKTWESSGDAEPAIPLTTTATLAAGFGHEYTYLLGSGAVPTLPTAVGNTSIYHLINTHTASINVATTSSQTVSGSAAPLTILPGESYTLVSDQSNWWIR